MRFLRSDGSSMVKILRNIVLVLFVVLFVSIVYNFRNRESNTVSALMAEATVSREFKGVFVRDETPVFYSGNGVLSYNVSDGGKVGNGSVIAEVYASEDQIALNRKINVLSKELDILEKIQNPGTLESAQPSAISDGIKENYRNLIACRDTENYDKLQTVKNTLVVQMSTYQIITEEVEGFKQQITDIKSELSALKAKMSKPLETIKSDKPAYFISYCDGYEDELSSKTLDKLTPEKIAEIGDAKISDQRIVGKLAEGGGWYLAGVVDNTRKEYSIGSRVSLKLESSEENFDAVIYDIHDGDNPAKSVIVLKCSRFSYDLVQHRVENVELIIDDARGLKVPREAIRFADKTVKENGKEKTASVKGVYIMKGEQVEFKKIDVVYEGPDYVLSDVHEDDIEYLALYDDIILEGLDD